MIFLIKFYFNNDFKKSIDGALYKNDIELIYILLYLSRMKVIDDFFFI